MPRLKLAFLGWGGHVHVERWAIAMFRLGHEVTVISVSGVGNYPPGIRQYRLGLEARRPVLRRLRLAWLLRRIRPDVLHVHWAHFVDLALGVWSGPLVVSAWGSDIYRREEQTARSIARLKAGLKRADVITCNSHDLAAEIASFADVPADRVQLVQWGVDTDLFRRVTNPSIAATLALEGRPTIFSARSFLPVYNQEMVVKAFAKVRKVLPDCMLVMKFYNGNAAYLESVLALAADLGVRQAIRVVEHVPYERMPELYSVASVTVSVPLSDAVPVSLFETMACGAVPIYSDLPSLREWIQDNVNGYLVAVDDPDMIAKRILDVLRDPAIVASFAERNREIVETRASQRVHMKEMTRLYAAVIARKCRRH